jgi:saxitoxin biosynthesis operon SxtJ-like protein
MVVEEIKNIKSGKRELRKFGITMGIVLLLLGGFSWWRGKDFYFYFLIVSTAFIFLGLVTPFVLKPVNKLWMSLAILMSWIMTRVILSALFYLGLTPMGFLARLFGKDFLEVKFDKRTSKTYWILKDKRKSERNNQENQF